MLALTRDQGRSAMRRFPPGKDSAPSDPNTECSVQSIGVNTSFALIEEGRDCFGGTAYSLIEEIYELRDGQPIPTKRNSTDF
ncbi:hypothetical protein [Burkholderia sp. BCC1999]|uniref:hypothetical protein n=1 Tax=Burkholderia sp. BCC1999 TaxID=2817448 RepID=UPI002AC32240|nr:hypothetical protein [Burkholderia sp. BCC1999]